MEINELAIAYVKPRLDPEFKPYGDYRAMKLTRFDGFDVMDAFEQGAKIAIGSLWHKATDWPEDNAKIVIVSKKGLWKVGTYHDDNPGFNETIIVSWFFGLIKKRYVIMHDVDKWAYVKDIFPIEQQ